MRGIASCRLAEDPRDALRAPESTPARQQDTQDASIEGPGNGGVRQRIAPLAEGGPEWKRWDHLVRILEADGLDRVEAKHKAAEELDLLVPETVQ